MFWLTFVTTVFLIHVLHLNNSLDIQRDSLYMKLGCTFVRIKIMLKYFQTTDFIMIT